MTSDGVRPEQGPIRVFVLDDHEVVRDALTDYINTDAAMEVVGTAGDAAEALRGIDETRPTVAVLDARLPEGSGMEVCRETLARHPEVRCVILTSHGDEEAYLAATLSGAAGYLVKTFTDGDLLQGIRTVARGGTLIERRPAEELYPRLVAFCDRRAVALDAEQRAVLSQAVGGASDTEIAATLHQSPDEVRRHLADLFRRLGIAGG